MNYYQSIGCSFNDYLRKQPTKKEALKNAKRRGDAVILPESNNRALIITDGKTNYLQSYDTVILMYQNGKIIKLWNDYSKTTLKHINTFLSMQGLKQLSKKEWLAL